jgi:hypothetical protein
VGVLVARTLYHQKKMKIAILVFVVLALVGPAALSVLAYKLKGPWTNPQIDAAGAAVRWASIGAIIILIAMTMLT